MKPLFSTENVCRKWQQVQWTDESKCEIFTTNRSQFVLQRADDFCKECSLRIPQGLGCNFGKFEDLVKIICLFSVEKYTSIREASDEPQMNLEA